APQSVGEVGAKVITDDAKPGGASQSDVTCALRDRRIRVVHDEPRLAFNARAQEQLFAAARPQHVEIDTDVRAIKARQVKRGLAASLYADEDDSLHAFDLIHGRLGDR